MSRYRKKPVETDAIQLRWTTWNEVCEFLGDALLAENPDGAFEIPADEASDTCGEEGPNYIALNVRTVHGETAIVRHGDWIIPEADPGRFYPCKPDIFAATYEPVAEAETQVALQSAGDSGPVGLFDTQEIGAAVQADTARHMDYIIRTQSGGA